MRFIYFFFVALAPIAAFVNVNIDQFQRSSFVPLTHLALLAVFVALVSFFIFKILSRLFNDGNEKILLLLAALNIVFFNFTVILHHISLILHSLNVYRGGVALTGFVILLTIAFIWRASSFVALNFTLKVGILGYSLVPIVQFPYLYYQLPNAALPVIDSSFNFDVTSDYHRPNVYYIVADGLTSLAVLEDYTQIPVGSVADELNQQGFVIVEDASSNYIASASSIGSLFHLNYFRDAQEGPDKTHPTSFFPAVAFRDASSDLAVTLNEFGYERFFSGSWYAGCDPRNVQCVWSSDLKISRALELILNQTPIGLFAENFLVLETDAISRLDETWMVENAIVGPPIFVFVHHMEPHSPWYYDSQCNLRESPHISEVVAYSDAVQCLFERLSQFLYRLNQYDPDAIVVVQGDHGWLLDGQFDTGVPSYLWPPEIMRQRSSISNFIKAPEHCIESLPQGPIGPMNTMRFVLSCISGQSVEYLQEKLLVPSATYDEFRNLTEYNPR